MTDEEYPLDEPREPREPAYRPTPSMFAVGGLVVGVVLGLVLAAVLGGNPFSDTNRVVYREVIIAQIEPDRICWSMDPDRRDADLECAILALDPGLAVPRQGDAVTVGFVPIRAPDGDEVRQVIWAGGGDEFPPAEEPLPEPADGEPADGEPAPEGEEPPADGQ